MLVRALICQTCDFPGCCDAFAGSSQSAEAMASCRIQGSKDRLPLRLEQVDAYERSQPDQKNSADRNPQHADSLNFDFLVQHRSNDGV